MADKDTTLLYEIIRTQEIRDTAQEGRQLSEKELMEIVHDMGLDERIARRVIKEGYTLPVPYEVLNIKNTLKDIYSLASIHKRTPHQIVNNLSLDSMVKEILHEAVGEQENYRHVIQLASKKMPVGEWSNFYGGSTFVGSAMMISQYVFYVLGFGMLPATLLGLAGGTMTGLTVRHVGKKMEGWYNEQYKLCQQQEAKATIAELRDERLGVLQQRLAAYIHEKKI